MFDRIKNVFEDFWISSLDLLPDLAIASVVLISAWILAKGVRWVIRSLTNRWDIDPNLQNLFSALGYSATLAGGLFSASAVLFPGLTAGDIVGVLGLGGVAVGFAFKDIFQNFLAGVLILGRRPFRLGDYIDADGLQGFVEDISFRNTILQTITGEEFVVPNSRLFTSAVRVQTARDEMMSQFYTGIAYDEDIEEARNVLADAVMKSEGVLQEPEPKILVSEHDASSVNFEIRYWTKSQPIDVRLALDSVASNTKKALDDAGIEIPFPQRVVHFRTEGEVELKQAA